VGTQSHWSKGDFYDGKAASNNTTDESNKVKLFKDEGYWLAWFEYSDHWHSARIGVENTTHTLAR